jgi:imidazoleglycerol-phosphate dehydratase
MGALRDVLVFDMDGVLVDVHASYRETIRATVRHFTGRDVSHEAIQQYKNSGGWNNDWALSQRICADYGVGVPYDTVVKAFQEYFFGKNNDGLVLQERWMPAPGLLERLSETYHLAIFTGRLHAEANFTLMRFVPQLEWAHIIGDDDVKRPKPAPDGLIAIAAEHPGAMLTYLGDTVDRNTKETQISGTLVLDGTGEYEISTGIRFFDHMLELFTKHGAFNVRLTAKGDLDVDQHHTVEDVGIVLGQLFTQALGDKKGINRTGYFVQPMDETLAVAAVDLGGRVSLVYKDRVKVRKVGDLQTELVEDFFAGFAQHAQANVHLKVLYGRSNHHKIEALFKCFARAMRYACSTDERLKDQLPSTKGLL